LFKPEISNTSALCKQESHEGGFQAQFLMSSSSLRIPWDLTHFW
jgi:hypothetical protein